MPETDSEHSHGAAGAAHENAHAAEAAPVNGTQAATGDGDLTTTVATIGVIAVGAALIEVSLIPGMLLGVAAMLAPKFVPKLGDGIRPLIKQTVRGAYKMAQKTREAVAEAGEQMQDLMAEARVEDEHAAAASKSASEAASAMKS
jgi:hypothetical protein